MEVTNHLKADMKRAWERLSEEKYHRGALAEHTKKRGDLGGDADVGRVKSNKADHERWTSHSRQSEASEAN